MKKKLFFIFILVLTIIILPACNYFEGSNLQNAGMLFDGEIDSNTWIDEGYKALLSIEEEFEVDVFYEENVRTKRDVRIAVDQFVREGVNLIIGHSNIFGNHFADISASYPDVHFIYPNGGIYNPSITSMSFDSHASGFFGGMIAGEMTESDEIGVIAVYSWQPELEGFYEGVKYQNPAANLHIDFVNDWENEEKAMAFYEEYRHSSVDIIFPAGNSYSEDLIQEAARDGIYSIGYIADQKEYAPEYVLTSLIQHIDKIYIDGVEAFNNDDIKGGVETYDFQDGFISLGEFNEKLPESFLKELEEQIEEYADNGLLPNERR